MYPTKRETNAQALDEARSIARRPMAQSLKDEREEIVVRCHLAKGDADRAVAETAGHDNPGKCMHACRQMECICIMIFLYMWIYIGSRSRRLVA